MFYCIQLHDRSEEISRHEAFGLEVVLSKDRSKRMMCVRLQNNMESYRAQTSSGRFSAANRKISRSDMARQFPGESQIVELTIVS